MSKGIMESEIKIPGTDVKIPSWALIAGVAGILAVLILAPKRGQDQGDFNEEGTYSDDSAGGAWELISELMDLMNNTGLNEVLEPIIGSPVSRRTNTGQDEPEISYSPGVGSPWTHEEHPFLVNPAGELEFYAGGAYDVPKISSAYSPFGAGSAKEAAEIAAVLGPKNTNPYDYIGSAPGAPATPSTGSITDYYAPSHEAYWAGYTPPDPAPTQSPNYAPVQSGITMGGDIA